MKKYPVSSIQYPNTPIGEAGFSLIELLVAATIFVFIVSGVTGLFVQAMDIQRRASGIQKIEENAQFVFESISREVRVSAITSPLTDTCPTGTLSITHPDNGPVDYAFVAGGGTSPGVIERNGEVITSSDVNVLAFAFCVQGSGQGDGPTRVTMAAKIESVVGRPANRVSASVQTTVVSRDLAADVTP